MWIFYQYLQFDSLRHCSDRPCMLEKEKLDYVDPIVKLIFPPKAQATHLCHHDFNGQFSQRQIKHEIIVINLVLYIQLQNATDNQYFAPLNSVFAS